MTNNFVVIMLYRRGGQICKADIEREAYSSEKYSYEAMQCSDVMETIFLLEESGIIKYCVDTEEIFINIDGMKAINELYDLDTLKDIQNNPKLSDIFARVGPPQDLLGKIHSYEDARKAAKTFSEGRKSLEELLYCCIINNIKTHASCAGHKKYLGWFDDGYVSFILDDELTTEFVKYLNGKLAGHENNISLYQDDDSTVIEKIVCNYETADKVFAEIQGSLEEYLSKKGTISKQNGDNELNKQINAMLEAKGVNKKSGFLDVIEGNIIASFMQNAIHFVETKMLDSNNSSREGGKIIE